MHPSAPSPSFAAYHDTANLENTPLVAHCPLRTPQPRHSRIHRCEQCIYRAGRLAQALSGVTVVHEGQRALTTNN